VVIQVPVTDARPAVEPERQGGADPEAAEQRRLHRRVVMAVLGAVFLAGAVTALFGKGGYLELRRMRGQLAAVEARVERQQGRVEALRLEVERLESDPMERERIAREQLGLARPGEITYVLTGPHGSESRAAGEGSSERKGEDPEKSAPE
jgi:cell division protein FtsB